jgi:hypothetical protein
MMKSSTTTEKIIPIAHQRHQEFVDDVLRVAPSAAVVGKALGFGPMQVGVQQPMTMGTSARETAA